MGNLSHVRVALENGQVFVVEERPDHPWRVDASVSLNLRRDRMHLFDGAGRRIG